MSRIYYQMGICAIMCSLVSCGEKALEQDNNITDPNALFVSVEDFGTPSSKTTLTGDDKVETDWKTSDRICVVSNDGSGNPVSSMYVFESVNSTGVAVFLPETEVTGFSLDRFVAAYYPGGDVTSCDLSGNFTVKIGSTQTYVSKYDISEAPMVSNSISTSSNGVTKEIKFKNVFGLLKLQFVGVTTTTVQSVDISSSTCALYGQATVNASTKAVTMPDFSNGVNNAITLDCGTPGQALTYDSDNPLTFYVAMPEVSSGTVTVIANTQDNGSAYGRESHSMNAAASGNAILANHIHVMPVCPILPAGYLHVKYLESAGKQRINTKMYPGSTLYTEIEISIDKNKRTGENFQLGHCFDNAIFGAHWDYKSFFLQLKIDPQKEGGGTSDIVKSTKGPYVRYHDGMNNTETTAKNNLEVDDNGHIIVKTGNWHISSIQGSSSLTSFVDTSIERTYYVGDNDPISLFATTSKGGANGINDYNGQGYFKCYYFKMWEQSASAYTTENDIPQLLADNLKRYFWPCIRTSDGEAMMYDIRYGAEYTKQPCKIGKGESDYTEATGSFGHPGHAAIPAKSPYPEYTERAAANPDAIGTQLHFQ